jgi:serpin B
MGYNYWLRRLAAPVLAVAVLHAAEGSAPGDHRFATAAYRELARGQGNLILSPYSIASALSMALEGARGRTAEEMRSVLDQFPVDLASLEKEANTGGNQLLTANGLWVQKSFAILPEFQQAMTGRFHAPAEQADFAGAPEQARAEINSWTDRHTKGKIRELFAAGSLNGSTRLVLTSAIYFYGKWQSAFPKDATKPAQFRLGTSGAVQADFMNQTGKFGYAEVAGAQVLELKYAGTPIVFDVILPKTDDGIAAFDTSIDPARLAEWLGAVQTRTVDVALPKFRADSEFSLAKTLSRMGMPIAFSGEADFSGIDGRKDLALSSVTHKAFVDVAEEGTEAAAATGIAVTRIAAVTSPRTVFRADHPFLFLIRDSKSGSILFEGRVMNPKAGKS